MSCHDASHINHLATYFLFLHFALTDFIKLLRLSVERGLLAKREGSHKIAVIITWWLRWAYKSISILKCVDLLIKHVDLLVMFLYPLLLYHNCVG